MLYKVCNSFVEMGSANVQASDYLKGVGQYFSQHGEHSMSSFSGLLRPTQPASIGTEEAILMPHSFLSSMEKWGLGGACLGILVWDPEPQGAWWVPSSISY